MNTNFDYGRMASDPVRSEAYVRAMKAAIEPGSTVLDLGCGSGIFSVLAAKLGAKKVYAIDPNPAINFGPKLAEKNGVAHKIEFIQGISSDLELSEPVDCIVSDLRGALPLYRAHLPTLKDATERLLKSGGLLIPAEDWIYAAPVRDDGVAGMLKSPWFENTLDLDLTPLGGFESNRFWRTRLGESDLCAPPKLWCKLRYREIDGFSFQRALRWKFAHEGVMNGVALWFDAKLYNGVAFSNHPGKEKVIYGQTLFPTDQIEYSPGQKISVSIEAKFLRDSYVWSWAIRLYTSSGDQIFQEEHTTISQNYLSPKVIRL